jgi:hypothetical protein
MDIIIGSLLLCIGLYVLYISMKSITLVCPKIVEYRYLPRTFEEEQREPVRPSVIFESMFKTQQPNAGQGSSFL